ncbi:SDR family oxidoreductase [Asanoa sp. NPDC050611]|uniref:SDR family oxidoreductase n=1 Tax=Asanoa sp. NPDC050611 TaxID=3157098 RepID=UPI0033E74664
MKIVVIGGTGLIGSKVVSKLGEHGHDAVAAAPNTGVNTITGEGLAEALAGADVVVDVSNSPSFDDAAVMDFFQTSTGNIGTAEEAAGVGHHVALSVVGTERLQESGYFRAKQAQEELIKDAKTPYSLLHATQFFEFVTSMANAGADGDRVRFAPVLFQPMASEDVADAVVKAALAAPLNATVEVAGPEQYRMDEFFRDALPLRGDKRTVVSDPDAKYFGAELGERTLLPGNGATLGEIKFFEWPGRDGSRH